MLISVEFNVDRLKKERFQSKNCCYIVAEDYIEGPDHRFVDMASLASPYVEGWFDYLFDYPLTPLIETTRGCPYSCTFCNDGPAIRSKIFSKPIEMIAEEFEYIGHHIKHSDQLIIADLNYGMYKEDLESAAIIRDTYEKYTTRGDGTLIPKMSDAYPHDPDRIRQWISVFLPLVIWRRTALTL